MRSINFGRFTHGLSRVGPNEPIVKVVNQLPPPASPMIIDGNGDYLAHRTRDGLVSTGARVIDMLRTVKEPYDALLVTGQSGIVPGSIAAYTLNKSLLILRKEDENSHGTRYTGEDWWGSKRAIILDDFISSGATICRLLRETTVANDSKLKPSVVGVLLYGHHMTDFEKQNGYIQSRAMHELGIILKRDERGHLFRVGRRT